MKTAINYVIGDATEPIGDGVKIIAHVCNDVGAWGAGFVLALSRKWKNPEQFYRDWHKGVRMGPKGWYNNPAFKLGEIQMLRVEDSYDLKNVIEVCNMIAQRGVGYDNTGFPPIRYDSVKKCLYRLAEICRQFSEYTKMPSVHMPRIGCGLAGGSWDIVSTIIEDTLCEAGIEVYVYDLA